MHVRHLLLAAAVLAGTQLATAGQVSYSFILPAQGGTSPTNWTQTDNTSVLKWDPANGQLLSITLNVTGTGHIHDVITDTNASASCGGVGNPPAGPDCGIDEIPLYMVSDFHLKLGDSGDPGQGNPSAFPLLTLQETTDTVTYKNLSYGSVITVDTMLTGSSTTVFDVLGTTGLCANPAPGCLENGYSTINNALFPNLNGQPVDPLTLSWFQGTGTVPLTVRAFLSKQITNGGGDNEVFSGDAAVQVTVTYEYAPEPGTIVLTGCALLGIGAMLRRRHLA